MSLGPVTVDEFPENEVAALRGPDSSRRVERDPKEGTEVKCPFPGEPRAETVKCRPGDPGEEPVSGRRRLTFSVELLARVQEVC